MAHASGERRGDLIGKSREEEPAHLKPPAGVGRRGEELVAVEMSAAGGEEDRRRALFQPSFHLVVGIAHPLLAVEGKAGQPHLGRPLRLRRGKPIGKEPERPLGRMDPITQQPASRWQAERSAEGIEPAADDGIDEQPVGEGPLERAEPMRAAVDKDPGHSRGIVEAAKQHRREVRGDQRHAEALLGNAGPEGEARSDDDRGLAGNSVGGQGPLDHPVDRLEEGAHKDLEDHRSAAEWVPDPLVLDRRDEVELGERVNKLEARLLGHLAKPPGSDQRDAHPATAQFPADPDEGMDIA